MSVLAKRVLTAVVLIGLLIWVLFFLPSPAALIFFAAFLSLGAWEWSGFVEPGQPLLRVLYVVALVALASLFTFAPQTSIVPNALLWMGLVGWLGVAGWMLTGHSGMPRWGAALAGFLALLPAWCAMTRILTTEQGAALLVWAIAIVAAADTGAYFVGRSVGRVKLAPAISPGKTREGMAGGVTCAALAGAAGAASFDQSPGYFAVCGAIIAAISVVGDLLVSACKRRVGLKDSGWILPGHGGVLDRIDGLLAALPLFVLLAASAGLPSHDFGSTR